MLKVIFLALFSHSFADWEDSSREGSSDTECSLSKLLLHICSSPMNVRSKWLREQSIHPRLFDYVSVCLCVYGRTIDPKQLKVQSSNLPQE